jgi:hypothetical protein
MQKYLILLCIMCLCTFFPKSSIGVAFKLASSGISLLFAQSAHAVRMDVYKVVSGLALLRIIVSHISLTFLTVLDKEIEWGEGKRGEGGRGVAEKGEKRRDKGECNLLWFITFCVHFYET